MIKQFGFTGLIDFPGKVDGCNPEDMQDHYRQHAHQPWYWYLIQLATAYASGNDDLISNIYRPDGSWSARGKQDPLPPNSSRCWL